ncbi:MAG TPA: methyltransferase domain-containing protein [Bryobacteraceae bacterium]|nr:methyltransferase domain-containing protein [Bryobacteraceae bacterium]
MAPHPARSKLRLALARAAITLAAAAFFCALRVDVATAAWHKARGSVKEAMDRRRAPGQIRDYIAENTVRKLQIGAGANDRKGWLNTDIEPIRDQAFLDATAPFPMPDGSMHYVYSEHLIEHLSYEEGQGMLRESYRVLAPGGKVRVATPNLVKFIGLFAEDKKDDARRYMSDKIAWHEWPATPDPECYILNQELRQWGHRFVYTPKLLRASLEAAGFREIRELQAGESDDPVFRGIELRSLSNVGDINRFETLVFEAVRPAQNVSALRP